MLCPVIIHEPLTKTLRSVSTRLNEQRYMFDLLKFLNKFNSTLEKYSVLKNENCQSCCCDKLDHLENEAVNG